MMEFITKRLDVPVPRARSYYYPSRHQRNALQEDRLSGVLYAGATYRTYLHQGLPQADDDDVHWRLGTVHSVLRGQKVYSVTPLEAALTKYIQYVFDAYKVTYFNACREYWC